MYPESNGSKTMRVEEGKTIKRLKTFTRVAVLGVLASLVIFSVTGWGLEWLMYFHSIFWTKEPIGTNLSLPPLPALIERDIHRIEKTLADSHEQDLSLDEHIARRAREMNLSESPAFDALNTLEHQMNEDIRILEYR